MKLHYREYGAGRPLIILHGLFGSGDNWHTIALRLQDRFHVFAPDLRNHGASPHSDIFTVSVMAEDAAELIGEVGQGAAHVAGHSLGGKVAMELALSRPDLVERLVVVDIAPKGYPPHHADLRDAMLSLDFAAVHSRRDAERLLSERIADNRVVLFLLKNLAHDGDGRYRWKLNLAAISAGLPKTGEAIQAGRTFSGPTLFLTGANSGYVDPERDRPQILSLFPNASIRSIAGAGHWLHAERPDEVVAALSEFLK